jgi:hypothetical protein
VAVWSSVVGHRRWRSIEYRGYSLLCVSFRILMATSLMMVVVWDDASYSLVDIDRRFRGAYCPLHWGI